MEVIAKQSALNLEDVPLVSIEENPFNSRLRYDKHEIKTLANSLAKCGLLSPIRVRRVESNRYQLIFGHRRVRAARLLGWNSIRAEVGIYDDRESLIHSVSENLERSNLSDYEKAVSFQRMKNDFGTTYRQIGELVGYTEAHVCNYFRMLKLFDEATIDKNPSLLGELHDITEHHARILLTIDNVHDRINCMHMVSSNKMSVRDLQRVVSKLGGLFDKESADSRKEPASASAICDGVKDSLDTRHRDLEEINRVLFAEFDLPRHGDFQSFANGHAFQEGFSIYGSFPPLTRIDDSSAIEREKHWFYRVAPKLTTKLKDVRTQIYSHCAIATLCIEQSGQVNQREVKLHQRGSIVFARLGNSWKIVHEHWSDFNRKGMANSSGDFSREKSL